MLANLETGEVRGCEKSIAYGVLAELVTQASATIAPIADTSCMLSGCWQTTGAVADSGLTMGWKTWLRGRHRSKVK